jgi:hypothetical protein
MQRGRLERFAPLTGVAFFVFAVASFIVGGESPDVDDSTSKVVEFWRDNDVENVIGALLGGLASLSLIWFGASLRSSILRIEGEPGRLGILAFAGALCAGIGVAIDSALQFATADAADELPAESIQTLNALYSDLFIPLTVGFAILLLAIGLAALRGGFLPRWLGWILSFIWILFFSPAGFFLFLATVLFMGVLSVVLFRREGAAAPPGLAGPPPPAAPPG